MWLEKCAHVLFYRSRSRSHVALANVRLLSVRNAVQQHGNARKGAKWRNELQFLIPLQHTLCSLPPSSLSMLGIFTVRICLYFNPNKTNAINSMALCLKSNERLYCMRLWGSFRLWEGQRVFQFDGIGAPWRRGLHLPSLCQRLKDQTQLICQEWRTVISLWT